MQTELWEDGNGWDPPQGGLPAERNTFPPSDLRVSIPLIPNYSESQMGGLYTGIRPVHIATASKMVSDYSGMIVQPHKVSKPKHTAV